MHTKWSDKEEKGQVESGYWNERQALWYFRYPTAVSSASTMPREPKRLLDRQGTEPFPRDTQEGMVTADRKPSGALSAVIGCLCTSIQSKFSILLCFSKTMMSVMKKTCGAIFPHTHFYLCIKWPVEFQLKLNIFLKLMSSWRISWPCSSVVNLWAVQREDSVSIPSMHMFSIHNFFHQLACF